MAIQSDHTDWQHLAQTLEQRQALGLPWVLYHEPHSLSVELLLCSPTCIKTAYSWQDLPDAEGYIIAPFHPSNITPIVFLSLTDQGCQRYSLASPKGKAVQDSSTEMAHQSSISESYRACFARFDAALRYGNFDKLVLARSKDETLYQPLPLIPTFISATQTYPTAYTYLLYTPQTGLWLGSTPELLCSAEGGVFQTMALAGTQLAPRQGNPPRWSAQHTKEQGYVTTYIIEALTALGLRPTTSPTQTVRAGNLVHLRTDITARLEGAVKLPQLLEALHPTPAVCGLPKQESLEFILENEQTDRSYYSGCLGILSPQSKSSIYVNLRCMQLLSPTMVRLYAGGGLILGSQLEVEWQETERKLQTMRSLLPL